MLVVQIAANESAFCFLNSLYLYVFLSLCTYKSAVFLNSVSLHVSVLSAAPNIDSSEFIAAFELIKIKQRCISNQAAQVLKVLRFCDEVGFARHF